MLNPVPYFSKHSVQSYAALPVAVTNSSKPQLVKVCRWCRVFTELTWNLSIRSKGTWVESFLMVLAYRKQIIQNHLKTVRRVVTINLCWRKSSCELFPLTTTHTKVANSGSGKMVIARCRIHYFLKKERRSRYRCWKISSLQLLAILVVLYCPALRTSRSWWIAHSRQW